MRRISQNICKQSAQALELLSRFEKTLLKNRYCLSEASLAVFENVCVFENDLEVLRAEAVCKYFVGRVAFLLSAIASFYENKTGKITTV